MKELTIEQKAKAYDEAFRIAQELYNDPNSSNVGKGYVCTVFPEVKESDDENIRKWIITQLELKSDVNNPHDLELMILKSIAWLEKQGEQKPIEWSEDEKIRKDVLAFIRREGQHIDKYKWHKWIAWLEKQGEQKPTDRVEPKFKNGQWIVWQDKCYKINYNGCGYELVDQNGLSTSLEYGTIDENAHIWDITKDAKDGDVLAYKDEISIYKHDIKNCTKEGTNFGGFVYHCCYDGKRFITDSLYSLTEKDKKDIYPATKEQRNLLFQKMKEAGYEWDAEKKELKKIENEIEIPFGAKDSELQEATYYIPKGFYSVLDGNKVIIKRFKNPRPQNN